MCSSGKTIMKTFAAIIGVFFQTFDVASDFSLIYVYLTTDPMWAYLVMSFITMTTLYNIYDVWSEKMNESKEEGAWKLYMTIASIFQLRGFVTVLRYCGRDTDQMVENLENTKFIEVVLEALPQTLLTTYVILLTRHDQLGAEAGVALNGPASATLDGLQDFAVQNLLFLSVTISFISSTFATTDGGLCQRVWGFLWSASDIFGRIVSIACLAVAYNNLALLGIAQVFVIRVFWQFFLNGERSCHVLLKTPMNVLIDLEEFQTEVEKKRSAFYPIFLHIIAIIESAYMMFLAVTSTQVPDGEKSCAAMGEDQGGCFPLLRDYAIVEYLYISVIASHVIKAAVAIPFAWAVRKDVEDDDEERQLGMESNDQQIVELGGYDY